MIENENYHVCSHCYESIKDKGMPFIELLESIFEIFSMLNEPIAIRTDRNSLPILEYLEKNQYILTTEFPDPANEKRDIVLAIPLGCHLFQQHSWFFCFDRDNHE